MCPERTSEDCLIKLRSKFKGIFGERHHLLNCCQHFLVSQDANSTNIPFLPCWIPRHPQQSPHYLAKEGQGAVWPRATGMVFPWPLPGQTSGLSMGSPCQASLPKDLVQSPAAREREQQPVKSSLPPTESQYLMQGILRHPCDFCPGFYIHQL